MFENLSIKTNKGFTLIELLVAMSIVAIMTSLLVLNYKPFKQELALRQEATKLAQNIRKAEEMAMSAQDFPSCGDTYSRGYGVYFKSSDPHKYFLFADCDNSGDYNSKSDKIVETINFNSRVKITSLSDSPLQIVFSPPNPDITISPSSVSVAEITISNDDGNSKKVKVNKSGLIYIQ